MIPVTSKDDQPASNISHRSIYICASADTLELYLHDTEHIGRYTSISVPLDTESSSAENNFSERLMTAMFKLFKKYAQLQFRLVVEILTTSVTSYSKKDEMGLIQQFNEELRTGTTHKPFTNAVITQFIDNIDIYAGRDSYVEIVERVIDFVRCETTVLTSSEQEQLSEMLSFDDMKDDHYHTRTDRLCNVIPHRAQSHNVEFTTQSCKAFNNIFVGYTVSFMEAVDHFRDDIITIFNKALSKVITPLQTVYIQSGIPRMSTSFVESIQANGLIHNLPSTYLYMLSFQFANGLIYQIPVDK